MNKTFESGIFPEKTKYRIPEKCLNFGGSKTVRSREKTKEFMGKKDTNATVLQNFPSYKWSAFAFGIPRKRFCE